MTSIIFFKFNKNLWWAFKQMGMHKTYFENIDGLIFYKMLGTGSSPGFSMYPDFSTYALLLIWEDKLHADKYFKSNVIGAFNILQASVRAYQRNLNTHSSYIEFRKERAIQRDNYGRLNSLELVNYLDKYAETGKEYVKIIKQTLELLKILYLFIYV